MDYEKYEWRTGRSCVYKIFYHLVFVTKYRRNVFTKEMLDRMNTIFKSTCLQMDCELHEFNGEDDHVHLLVSIPTKLAISTIVGKLKGKSSYFLRLEFWDQLKKKLWGDHLWSPSYCCVTCGGAPLNIVKKYIEDQRQPPTKKGVTQSLQERKVQLHTDLHKTKKN